MDLEKNSSYVVDRVLTPSIFRVRAKAGGHGREFGTQTDIHYGKYTTEDAESTERLIIIYYSKYISKFIAKCLSFLFIYVKDVLFAIHFVIAC